MYYVYMLRCEGNSLYTGITTDVKRRFSEHKYGGVKGAKYTKLHKPLSVAAAFEVADKSDALKLEARIKKLSKDCKEKLISENTNISALYNIEIKRISV